MLPKQPINGAVIVMLFVLFILGRSKSDRCNIFIS